jgi:enamine deaminase RidA (YjgF/YER057c/UK114 family)
MGAEANLGDLGITLPDVAEPVADYVPYKRSGDTVYVSGQVPLEGGDLVHEGRVGEEVTVDEGYEAARVAAINVLAALRDAAPSTLDDVTNVVRLEGHVASAPDFHDQPSVVDGASELVGEVFGERGKHARLALGASELPLDAPVEVAAIAEVVQPA